MKLLFIGCVVAGVLLFSRGASAETYENAKIVHYSKADAKLQVEVDGQTHTIKISHHVTIFDEQGKRCSYTVGLRRLGAAQTVSLKTEPDASDPNLEIASGDIHLNPGKVAAERTERAGRKAREKAPASAPATQPQPRDLPDLTPDPNYKGEVVDVAVPALYAAWFPSAKVGDFVVIETGQNAYMRREVLAIDKGAVVIADVGNIDGAHTETRVKMTMAPAQRSQAGHYEPAKKARSKEQIKVGGRELICDVVKSGKATTWSSPQVPFDNVVKMEAPQAHVLLLDYGRGK